MDTTRFTQAYRPSGKEYENIFMWNRFLRKKLELLITFAPTILCILSIIAGFYSAPFIPIYALLICYPLVAYFQFKLTISKHLRNRKEKDNATCEVNIMNNGILLINNDYEIRELHKWEDIKVIYDKFGYYLIYGNKKMLALLKKENIPNDFDAKSVFAKHNIELVQPKI